MFIQFKNTPFFRLFSIIFITIVIFIFSKNKILIFGTNLYYGQKTDISIDLQSKERLSKTILLKKTNSNSRTLRE